MLPIDKYHGEVANLVSSFLKKEEASLRMLGETVLQSLRNGGVWHIFGSGHSALLADELFHRAGGLVPINSMTEVSLSPLVNPAVNREMERDETNAHGILDKHSIQSGEPILLISNSGVNGITVELAKMAKEKGLVVCALTSVAHSKAGKSRHSTGKKLYEVADIVIDSSLPAGDAILDWNLGDKTFKSGASSMVLGSVALHTVESIVVNGYVQAGELPPVLISANAIGGDEHNKVLEEKYSQRITKMRS